MPNQDGIYNKSAKGQLNVTCLCFFFLTKQAATVVARQGPVLTVFKTLKHLLTVHLSF